MLKSIVFIKSVHTIIFVFMSGALAVLLYEIIVNKITIPTWLAVALFVIEGVVLITNGWKCPLTSYAESLGSTHGQVTDIFLPKWFAYHVFQIYGTMGDWVTVSHHQDTQLKKPQTWRVSFRDYTNPRTGEYKIDKPN